MMRDIERRLQKLESQVPPPPPTDEEKTAQYLQRFLTCAIAYYLGDPTPRGSVAEAYSRALGYSHSYEFIKDVNAKDRDLLERVRLAKIKLLEKFGVSAECGREEIIEALLRMEAGLPERYKACCRKRYA